MTVTDTNKNYKSLHSATGNGDWKTENFRFILDPRFLIPRSQLRKISCPFHGIVRPFHGIIRSFPGMSRPFRGMTRSFSKINRPFPGTRRPFPGTSGPFPGTEYSLPLSKSVSPQTRIL